MVPVPHTAPRVEGCIIVCGHAVYRVAVTDFGRPQGSHCVDFRLLFPFRFVMCSEVIEVNANWTISDRLCTTYMLGLLGRHSSGMMDGRLTGKSNTEARILSDRWFVVTRTLCGQS
jgi:hypothetical protein